MKIVKSTQDRDNDNTKPKRVKISESVRFRLFRRDGFRCQYCGGVATETKLSIDHIIPVSKGGTNNFNNLITACIICNRGKSDEDIEVNQQNKTKMERHQIKRKRRELAWLDDDLTKKIFTAIAMRCNKKKIIRETGAKEGTVKNRLRRLEAHGYIKSHREINGQPNQRFDKAIPLKKEYSDCGCGAGWSKGVVLDPFAGIGTAALKARKEGRDFIGIELNEEYIKIANRLLSQKTIENY